MNREISICGDVCSECPRYKATMADDISALERVAELWHRTGLRDRVVSPDEIKCTGCTKQKPCVHGVNNCEHLGVKENCGECDFFPCEKIEMVFKKTDDFNRSCQGKCTPIEYEELYSSFLIKEQVLNEINRKFNLRHRAESFRYAFNGIKILIRNEHNAWIHLLAAVCAIIAGIFLKISIAEWCLVAVVSGFVFAAEAFNSSIERLSDFVHPEKHEIIKNIKDLSAGAVLISAITAFAVGLLVFAPKIFLLVKSLF